MFLFSFSFYMNIRRFDAACGCRCVVDVVGAAWLWVLVSFLHTYIQSKSRVESSRV